MNPESSESKKIKTEIDRRTFNLLRIRAYDKFMHLKLVPRNNAKAAEEILVQIDEVINDPYDTESEEIRAMAQQGDIHIYDAADRIVTKIRQDAYKHSQIAAA